MIDLSGFCSFCDAEFDTTGNGAGSTAGVLLEQGESKANAMAFVYCQFLQF
jgi:hypothetical protein